MDEIHAAILNIQLKNLDKNNNIRRKIAEYYNESLSL